MKIAFIGAGKMAEALIARLSSQQVFASDVNPARLNFLRKKYRIKICPDNQSAFEQGEVVILAVKPQQMAEALDQITRYPLVPREIEGFPVSRKKLIISIAAGIPLSYLQKKLAGFSVIRAMPNNPCMIGEGITALTWGEKVLPADRKRAEQIFRAVGDVIVISENKMDAVTGLSGSGPAFVYLALEGLIEGGMAAGLDRKTALRLALRTAEGAAMTARRAGIEPAQLREMVTSPGGTTMEGLRVLEEKGMKKGLKAAVVAAAQKSKALSRRWAQ